MSTESLITNTEYNTKMDKNISILSDTESVLPEDLSYAITINTPNEEVEISNKIPNRLSNNKYLILKINILIVVGSVIFLYILYL
jgi:nitrogen regulatory protein PII-like uncharacterized protein